MFTDPAYFHTYSIHWTPDAIEWLIDGGIFRTVTRNDTFNVTGQFYQYPQTPMQPYIRLGGPVGLKMIFSNIKIDCWNATSPPGTNTGLSYWYKDRLALNTSVVTGDRLPGVDNFTSINGAADSFPHGIPGGTIAGIVVGVIAFFLICVIIIWVLYRRRAKMRRDGMGSEVQEKPELETPANRHELSQPQTLVELSAEPMMTSSQRQLDHLQEYQLSSQDRHELPAEAPQQTTSNFLNQNPTQVTDSQPQASEMAPWQLETTVTAPWPPPGDPTSRPSIPTAVLADAADDGEEELRRLRDEERAIDEAIAESERLRMLRMEKEMIRKRIEEVKGTQAGVSGTHTI